MGGYIRMDKDLEDDPRVLALADSIADHLNELIDKASDLDLASAIRGIARNAALGALYRLWRYGDTHLGRYNRLKGALHGPARISNVTALPTKLLDGFPEEWLRVHEDGTVELPDYAAKNNLINRDVRREQNRERVRRFRERKRAATENGNGAVSVTEESLHRYKSVTTGPGTGPGTGTEPTETGTGPGDRSGSLASAAAPLARREEEQIDSSATQVTTDTGFREGIAATRAALARPPTPPEEIERRRQAAAAMAERCAREAKT